MTPEQKQSELLRHHEILLATMDYFISIHGASFVLDNENHIRDHYERQKNQIDKYYKQLRLDRLQQKLASITTGLQNRADLAYAPYIKQKTGYDIDIFEDLRKRFGVIIEQNEIRNQAELNEVASMLHFFQETSAEGKEVEILRKLISNYSQQMQEKAGKRKTERSKVISRVEKDDGTMEVTVEVSTGPKPKHYEEQVAISPDKKRRLRVAQWSDSKHASTYVAIEFPTSSGAVYGLSGIYPDLKAWWKDNSTIVIETKKEYTANTQHKLVRSFEDVIAIEYIER